MTEASRCFTHSPSQVYPERKQSINTISVPPQISYLYDPARLILAQMQLQLICVKVGEFGDFNKQSWRGRESFIGSF